jgi:hypothetical protein
MLKKNLKKDTYKKEKKREKKRKESKERRKRRERSHVWFQVLVIQLRNGHQAHQQIDTNISFGIRDGIQENTHHIVPLYDKKWKKEKRKRKYRKVSEKIEGKDRVRNSEK